MIIRFKKSSGAVVELMAQPDNIDYWIDTGKGTLCIDVCGKTYVVRRGTEKKLQSSLDLIHEAVVREKPFVDLTS